jgi:hypothetical protein
VIKIVTDSRFARFESTSLRCIELLQGLTRLPFHVEDFIVSDDPPM